MIRATAVSARPSNVRWVVAVFLTCVTSCMGLWEDVPLGGVGVIVAQPTVADAQFEARRGRLSSIAYRILGSASDAVA